MDASFYTNSYNRLPLLKNLLRSFEYCNKTKQVEWIITDYGSTDGSREWLMEYKQNAAFPVHVILGDEKEYFATLLVPVLDRRARFEAILRKYRNEARKKSSGTYVFDVGTDHQFIREADYFAEIDEVMRHRLQNKGKQDLSGVITFGYFRGRLDKPNNARGKLQNKERVPYVVAKEKAYVDYMVMYKDMIAQVGPYLEIADLQPGTREMDLWVNHDDSIRPESQYMNRCEALGLHRAFLKYPFQISFTNAEAKQFIQNPPKNDELLVPIWQLEDLQKKFSWLNRPLSSDELRRIDSLSLKEKAIYYAKLWIK